MLELLAYTFLAPIVLGSMAACFAYISQAVPTYQQLRAAGHDVVPAFLSAAIDPAVRFHRAGRERIRQAEASRAALDARAHPCMPDYQPITRLQAVPGDPYDRAAVMRRHPTSASFASDQPA